MIKKISTTTFEWQLLRRLDAAGCAINWNQVEEPCYPLSIIHQPAALGTEILPAGKHTGLAFRLRITASVGIRISGIKLETDWIQGQLVWLSGQPEYQFRNCCGGEVRFGQWSLLNRRIREGLTLKRGESVSGYLAFILSNVVPLGAGGKLSATLLCEDQFGRSYPYSLELDNSQTISGAGDTYCQFVSAV
jgi:hypothetical protein